MTLALVLLAVFVGAAAQRITGMGFALVAAPLLILVIGGFAGVLVVNVCAALTSLAVLTRLWREVNWARWRVLVAGALIGILPGAWLVSVAPKEWLDVVVGALVVAGLVSALLVRSPFTGGAGGILLASGAVSGLMSVTAGVGGPAVSAYAVATGWEQRVFAATMQPYFLTIGLLSVSAKLVLHPTVSPLSVLAWVGIVATCTAGVAVGGLLQSKISQVRARRLLIGLALIGACSAMGRGLWTIAQG